MDPDAVGDGEWGQLRDGCIRWGGDRQRGSGNFWGEFGVFHCNQRGHCDVAVPKLLWAGLVITMATPTMYNRIQVRLLSVEK